MRILIVEDEMSLRELYYEELSDLIDGARIFSAENGIKALELISQNEFDIIITDGRMPEMGGVELAREIRKSDTKTPILLVTGFIQDFDAVLKENIFTQIVDKPVNFDNLVQSLKSLV